MHIHPNNDPQSAFDFHPTLRCPHCGATSGMTAISIPRHEYLSRFRPPRCGIVYRCDACNAPVFLKFTVTYTNPITLSDTFELVERPAETFELQYLPDDVQSDFREALTCYSQSCWNAFAAMCRRTLQSAASSLGSEGTTRVQAQVAALKDMQLVDDEGFEQLREIMLAGHDGSHPHLPKLSPERAAVLLELIKDALYQLFVRQAKIKESTKLRAEAQARGRR